MTFLDTNVFVYFVDSRDVRKQSTARMILAKALRSSDYVISDQVLAAAESAGCDTILTEDLNDNQVYNGVRAVNPFKEEVAG